MTINHKIFDSPVSGQNILNGTYSNLELQGRWKIPVGIVEMNVGAEVSKMIIDTNIIPAQNIEAQNGATIAPDSNFVNIRIPKNGNLILSVDESSKYPTVRHIFTQI